MNSLLKGNHIFIYYYLHNTLSDIMKKTIIPFLIIAILIMPGLVLAVQSREPFNWSIQTSAPNIDETIYSSLVYQDQTLLFTKDSSNNVNYWSTPDGENATKLGTTITVEPQSNYTMFQDQNDYYMVLNETVYNETGTPVYWDFFTDFSTGEPPLTAFQNGTSIDYITTPYQGIGGTSYFSTGDNYGYILEDSYLISNESDTFRMRFKLRNIQGNVFIGLYDSTDNSIICGARITASAWSDDIYAIYKGSSPYIRTRNNHSEDYGDKNFIIEIYLENGNLWIGQYDINGLEIPGLDYTTETPKPPSSVALWSKGIICLDIPDTPTTNFGNRNHIGIGEIAPHVGRTICTEIGIREGISDWEPPTAHRELVIRETSNPTDFNLANSYGIGLYGEPVEVIKEDDTYYLYTKSISPGIHIYSSTNLNSWTYESTILEEIPDLRDITLLHLKSNYYIIVLSHNGVNSTLISYQDKSPLFDDIEEVGLIWSTLDSLTKTHIHRDNVYGETFESTGEALWGFYSDSNDDTFYYQYDAIYESMGIDEEMVALAEEMKELFLLLMVSVILVGMSTLFTKIRG